MRNCKDRLEKLFFCTGLHKFENHQCEVAGYNKGKGKICGYITPKYANCSRTYIANFPHCRFRH